MNAILTPESAQALGKTLRVMAVSIENLGQNSEGGVTPRPAIIGEARDQATVEPVEDDGVQSNTISQSGSGSAFLRSYVSYGGGINFALYGVVSGLVFRRYVSTLLTSVVAGVSTLIAVNLLGYASVQWRELFRDGNQKINRLLRWTRRRPSLNNDNHFRNDPPEFIKVILSKPFMAGFLGSLFL